MTSRVSWSTSASLKPVSLGTSRLTISLAASSGSFFAYAASCAARFLGLTCNKRPCDTSVTVASYVKAGRSTTHEGVTTRGHSTLCGGSPLFQCFA